MMTAKQVSERLKVLSGRHPSVETIEIKGIENRRAAIVFMHPAETEIGVFSNGKLEISDEFNTVILDAAVIAKLRTFLEQCGGYL